jgi:hypothetical protein
MTGVAPVPRSRGGVSGVLLIVLGAWGGLVPFVGPYFHYAYTPDKAWSYTSGRLWLSIAPGAAALLGGLLVVLSAHRAVGVLGALLAALGGAWFVVGTGIVKVVVKDSSISAGSPLSGALGPLSSATRQFLELLGFFTATGVLIVFLAALAMGRFSVVGVRDAPLAEEPSLTAGMSFPGGSDQLPDEVGMPASTGEFPVTQYPATESADTAQEQYPTSTSPFRRQPPTGPGPLQGP